MAERINKVILVLDREYDGELSSVASDSHVWLVESPANRENCYRKIRLQQV
jgi:hypothetical protein